MEILMDRQKVKKYHFSSFRWKPESSKFNNFWIPDQARYDSFGTFYECINFAIQSLLITRASDFIWLHKIFNL